MTRLTLHGMARLRHIGPSILLLGLLGLPSLSTARSPLPPDAALKQAISACNKDPAYRLGGAATGDCLEIRSTAVDVRIGKLLNALTDQHCPSIGEILRTQHTLWQQHRQNQCGIYRQMADNTAMYINATVCHLRMGLQRAHELEQLAAFQPGQLLPCKYMQDKASTP